MLVNWRDAPGLIDAIVDFSHTRRDHVADEVLMHMSELVNSGMAAPTVGVYSPSTKSGSNSV